MTGKRKDTRAWQPLQRAVREENPRLRELARINPQIFQVLRDGKHDETWMNDLYVVTVRRHPHEGHVTRISVRRQDRRPVRDWRDLQRIKNQVAGPDAEAIELYPAQKRVVDCANQTWLWVLPPGTVLPVGFAKGEITGAEEAARFGAVQREPGEWQ